MEKGEGIGTSMLAFFIVAIAVMFAVSGFAVVSLMEKLDSENAPYKDMRYTVAGTRTVDAQTYDFTGEGESDYRSETDNYRTFVFSFRQTSPEGDLTAKAELVCDSRGVPIDLYVHEGGSGSVDYWTFDSDGTHYRYGIEGDLVVSVEIGSPDLTLRADIVRT
jgi:hypothetical protein